ncbi:DUF3775 domain-containing protein [Paracoccus cavernae]|uniref:DUF3775 domain-containing protein n=1 Tax=Paracoccus cavernae TaxID=1571207 RepID=UPI0035F32970
MDEITTDKIAYVILLAREMGADQPLRSARSELREFLEGLDEDEKAGLIALMWIGRETFAPEELPEAVRTARAERGERPDDYLIAEPQLADFLESGMEALGFSPEDETEAILRPV